MIWQKKCKKCLNCENEICLLAYMFFAFMFFICLIVLAALINMQFSVFYCMFCLCVSIKGEYLFVKTAFYPFIVLISSRQNYKKRLSQHEKTC